MNPTELQPSELMQIAADFFESEGIHYRVVGSMASTQSERARIKRITSEGEYSVWFGSPEDVLLNKLVYFKLGGGESQKHLRDIGGMLKLLGDTLDRDYVALWAKKLGVHSEWELVLKPLKEPNT